MSPKVPKGRFSLVRLFLEAQHLKVAHLWPPRYNAGAGALESPYSPLKQLIVLALRIWGTQKTLSDYR